MSHPPKRYVTPPQSPCTASGIALIARSDGDHSAAPSQTVAQTGPLCWLTALRIEVFPLLSHALQAFARSKIFTVLLLQIAQGFYYFLRA
ncbi:hypothetical protein DFO62_101632 [Serratia fonticola]|nr:hypothetical protein DFO62_101632 [Serratia fonticola]